MAPSYRIPAFRSQQAEHVKNRGNWLFMKKPEPERLDVMFIVSRKTALTGKCLGSGAFAAVPFSLVFTRDSIFLSPYLQIKFTGVSGDKPLSPAYLIPANYGEILPADLERWAANAESQVYAAKLALPPGMVVLAWSVGGQSGAITRLFAPSELFQQAD